jgi:nucleoside phosphorylase
VKPLLILTAVDLEARTLARHLGLTAVAGTTWPHFFTGSIELACVGLRASALAARADRFRRPSLVISAGACGALAPELAEGELVVPDAVVTEDGARTATTPVPGIDARGTLVTVTRVVTTGADKARLWMETGALACDMESAVVAEWARARGVAAAVVRGVDGRVRGVAAVRAALMRRGALRDALALRRGTTAALASVAAALARIARS